LPKPHVRLDALIAAPVIAGPLDHLRRVRAFRSDAFRRDHRAASVHRVLTIGATLLWVVLFALAGRAGAQATPDLPQIPDIPSAVPSGGDANAPSVATPTPPAVDTPSSGASVDLQLPDVEGNPSTSVLIVLGLTLLSLAPSLIIMTTGFTRMVIVLSLTRNALGLPAIPPNQVITGLALFLTFFVMAPTLSEMNELGLQPLLNGEKSVQEATSDATAPLRDFMLANTRKAELDAMIGMSGEDRPDTAQDVSLTTLVPAFILSELKTAFIIGFVIFIPFLVIDLAVSSVLMSLGMMMLPPAFIALPFKLLLFVMVDGWGLVADSLVRSFN
jgi:flagellar biosynthesis protein FliP